MMLRPTWSEELASPRGKASERELSRIAAVPMVLAQQKMIFAS